MRGKVTNIIPRMYGKSDFFTYFSVSPHSFLKPHRLERAKNSYFFFVNRKKMCNFEARKAIMR